MSLRNRAADWIDRKLRTPRSPYVALGEAIRACHPPIPFRESTVYKDRSEPIRTERWQGQEHIPYQDDPTSNMKSERQDAVIAIATRRVCTALSQLPVKVMKTTVKDGKTLFDPDDNHPFNEILKIPNTDKTTTFADVTTHILQSLILTGHSFTNQDIVGGDVADLWPLEPDKMKIEISKKGQKTGYRYNIGTSSVSYNPDEIIMHRLYNINDLTYGGSLIEPIHAEALQRHYINLYQKGFFKNGAHIDTVFSPKNELKEGQGKRLAESINAKHGGAENAKKTFIMPIAGDLKNLGGDNKDLGFEPLLKMARELILAILGVPPFIGGVMEYANYANADVQEKSFWRHTMLPFIRIVQDGFNTQCLWQHYDPDHVLQFDISGVEALQEDALKATQNDSLLIGSGIQTIDEIRAKRGLEPLPEPEPVEVVVPDENEPEEEREEIQLDPILANARNTLSRSLSRYAIARRDRFIEINTNGNGHKENANDRLILTDTHLTAPPERKQAMEAPKWLQLLNE